MKRRLLTIIVIGTALITGFIAVGDSDYYARIGKSIETFGAVFREVSSNYVDDVDPSLLVEAGIDGMLAKLDPYTEYMTDEEQEDVDMLSTGLYTGFGISVSERESGLVITNIRADYPASQAGLRIGDRLIEIDGDRVDTLSTKALRKYTRGEPGSQATVRIVREGRADTITTRVTRVEVLLDNVTHIDRLPGDIGYVKLSRFSRRAPEDLRNAIAELRERGEMKALILDLRDNPGGLLDAAVGVVRLFVPKGSPIVATRGRDSETDRAYVSNTEPVEPHVPLSIIINERSASASEIVAGALQDLDRAVVVGRRSFGKGLVQTVVPLPHDAALKMTTSRYFIPSGRSIQKIDYSALRGNLGQHDTTQFRTRNGRLVRELKGIEPDTTVSDSDLPAILEHLRKKDVFFRFGTIHAATMAKLPDGFTVDKNVLESFYRYVEAQPPAIKSATLAALAESRDKAEEEGWPATTVKNIEQAEKLMERDIARQVRQHQDVVKDLLEAEIRARFDGESARISRALRLDPCVKASIGIVSSKKYSGILGGHVGDDQ